MLDVSETAAGAGVETTGSAAFGCSTTGVEAAGVGLLTGADATAVLSYERFSVAS